VSTRPKPGADHVTEPFWHAAAEGRLLVQRCINCGVAQHYPRAMCRECAGDTEWQVCSGRGTLYTFSIVRQNRTPPFDALVPYVVAMIDLEEGARMMGNVTDCDPDTVRIGMPVEVWFEHLGDEVALPQWRPA
jgi:uncharacterized OB-fold protein